MIPYKKAWNHQQALFDHTVKLKYENRSLPVEAQKPVSHHLLFCEHPPVYTLGKSGKARNLLIDLKELQKIGAEFYRINRGGDITFHGPGQLVGYPILNLDAFNPDIIYYLRSLEEIFIRLLADYGLKGERSESETGVWLETGTPYARKILALGVRTSRWVSMHGWGFNVNTDLGYFRHIIPCGIEDKQVTSLQKELGRPVPMAEVKEKAKRYFEEVLGVELI